MSTAYPLSWPDGWPRSKMRLNDDRFGDRLTTARAVERLHDELRLLGAQNVIVSSNIELRADGVMRGDDRRQTDPGVAIYFTLHKKQLAMARDAYVSVAGNLRSLGLVVEAMRQMARHGGERMMQRAFSGFVALAPPPDWKKPRAADASDLAALKAAMAAAHPDRGGSTASFMAARARYDAARRQARTTRHP